MEKLINCKSCGKEISKKAKICPHCGRSYKKSILWIFIPIILIIGILFLFRYQISEMISSAGMIIEEYGINEATDAFNNLPLIKVYSVGETGPAGGIVFYDKGLYNDGWRYMEAAPPSTEFIDISWGAYKYDIDSTSTDIGTGNRNTQIINRFLSNINEDGMITQLCTRLNYNGYNDWFLPSKDELTWLYNNLAQNGLGGFANVRYWSSSQYDPYCAWYIHFGDNGRSSTNYNKLRKTGPLGLITGEIRARAIRIF